MPIQWENPPERAVEKQPKWIQALPLLDEMLTAKAEKKGWARVVSGLKSAGGARSSAVTLRAFAELCDDHRFEFVSGRINPTDLPPVREHPDQDQYGVWAKCLQPTKGAT